MPDEAAVDPRVADVPELASDESRGATERTALKEWAVLCDALAQGEIVAMVRKGGIREQRAGFSVKHNRFALYPTYFHEKAAELAPRFHPRLAAVHAAQPAAGVVRIELIAEVVGVWAVGDLDRLRAVEHEQGLTWDALVSRFHYKGRPGVQVVVLRTLRLPAPLELPEIRRYQGCVSWVALDDAIDVSRAEQVLDEAVLRPRVARIAAALDAPVQTPAEG